MNKLAVGDTLRLKHGIDPKRHLWFVAFECNGDIVIFNSTTKQAWSDLTCQMKPGDHPKIVRDSVVIYGYGRLYQSADIAKFEKDDFGGLDRPASRQLISRIQAGAKQSPHTNPAILRFIKANNL